MKAKFATVLSLSLVAGLVACIPQKSSDDATVKAVEQPWSTPLSDAEKKLLEKFDTKNYTMDLQDSFPTSEIGQHQLQSPDTPAPLRGVWYMDGNPLHDRTVAFRNLIFKREGNENIGYFPVFGDNNYSYTADDAGMNLYAGAVSTFLVYKVIFNANFTEGQIIPTVQLGFLGLSIPTSLLDFKIKLIEDGYFLRQSFFAGKSINTYHFRRIIDEQGRIVEHSDKRWEKFLANAGPRLVLPKRK